MLTFKNNMLLIVLVIKCLAQLTQYFFVTLHIYFGIYPCKCNLPDELASGGEFPYKTHVSSSPLKD